jgi:hypothetical protein
MIHHKDLLQRKFDEALRYRDFVALGDADGHRPPWDERYGRLELSAEQRSLVAGFTRKINVLCLTGTWCGDCALQGSAMQRIADANPDCIDLRFILREEKHADLIVPAQLNGGFRIPVSWFMAEDFEPVSWFGDRTLSRYRSMARKAGLPPEQVAVLAEPSTDPVHEVMREMLDEFERAHLLLRLSTRFRQKYGD